jgi:hypothetical protein
MKGHDPGRIGKNQKIRPLIGLSLVVQSGQLAYAIRLSYRIFPQAPVDSRRFCP